MRLTIAACICAVLATAGVATAQEWRDRMEASLSTTKSYTFDDQALGDILRVLGDDADVNVIVDDGINRLQKLTLKVNDMTIANVLTWVTRLSGLDWVIQDEAVFITTYPRLDLAGRRQVETRRASDRAAAARTWLPGYEQSLAKSFDLTLSQKRLADVRDPLQSLLGVNVIISPALDPKTPITLAVNKMSGSSLLGWIARKANADFVIINQAVYFAPTDQVLAMRSQGLDLSGRAQGNRTVSFAFNGTPLDEALKTLSEQSGTQISLRGDVTPMPRVTVSGNDMALQSAITAVTNASGFNSAVIPSGDALVIQLVKPAPRPMPPVMESTAAGTAPPAPAY